MLAVAGLVIAAPVLTWWLVGDRSTVPAGADPDYAFQPLDVGPGLTRAAGIGSAVVAVVALLTLVRATRRNRLDPHWWGVVVPLLTAGVLVGSGWRLMTAGVIGANIGAGLTVLLGGPVVAALLIWATCYATCLSRRGRRAGQGRA
ncbi:hypothetical protein I0C86_24485 [Plantactinospora sp. S1510]|uniref:Uncharacterized protein n=1 Tax=Plantactinospora alkalitolerans TaxID=2789879 RepID=A0ABS0H0V3_9ACTN|nr:hypothetical protein [Plantactinospora alkalitolerans]MBF9132094.1 hypothetical protein [Plantactinospora alkalitolerans]